MESYVQQFVGDGDSDDSFLFGGQPHANRRKQATATSTDEEVDLQALSRKIPKSGNIAIDQTGKENHDDHRRNSAKKSNKHKFFPKPPPTTSLSTSTTKNEGETLYCSRILQSNPENHHSNKNSFIIQEYTCECCQELPEQAVFINNPKAIKKSITQRAIVADDVDAERSITPRAIVVDDVDAERCEQDDDEILSAAILSDTSTIDHLDDSFEVEDKPIKHPSRKLADKIARKQYIREDDSTDCSFVVQSSNERNDGGFKLILKKKDKSAQEAPKKVDVVEAKQSDNHDDEQEFSRIPSEIVVPKNAPEPILDEDDQKKHLSNLDTMENQLASKVQPDIVDLIGSDASSYSGSDNSFLDRKPIPPPKAAATQRPSFRNRIKDKSATIWNKTFDFSSDSDVEICSPPRRRRIHKDKEKAKATPARRLVILESSSEEEDDNWGVARNDNCSIDSDHSLNELMKQVGLQDDRKKQQKSDKYHAPKKSKSIHKCTIPAGSMIINDDSSLEALKRMDKETESGDDGTSPMKDKIPIGKPRARATSSKLFKRKSVEKPQVTSTVGNFRSNREVLARELFKEYDRKAFDGRLASVELVWSNKLQTTAGLTRLITKTMFGKIDREAKIELATKIIDDMDRLMSTLLHEMCHAAQWLVDSVAKPAHGKCFQKWSKIAMSKVPGVVVTTTHTYEISYKYAWACTTEGCKVVIKRQSKSVDVTKQCCGKCKGRLMEIEVPKKGQSTSNGGAVGHTPKKTRPASAYNLFVKEHSKAARESLAAQRKKEGNPLKVSQTEVLKECARLWKEHKGSKQ